MRVDSVLAVAVLTWSAAIAAAHESTPGSSSESELATKEQKESYALGMSLARQLKARSIPVDLELLTKGLRDSFHGSETLITEQDATALVAQLQQEVKREAKPSRHKQLESARQEGATFLAANRTKSDVVVLPSGLQYKVLKAGSGATPAPDDIVICHYRGTLVDGTEFDNSYKRGKPAAFSLRRTMRAWKEALPLMPVGSKWELYVPAELAYGSAGAGSVIGPDATLIFQVELLGARHALGSGADTIQVANGADTVQVASGADLGIVQSEAQRVAQQAAAASPVKDITISFKLDPRLSGPTYGGEHWVAPKVFSSTPQAGEAVLEARASAVDSTGSSASTEVQWTPADPKMLTVTPGSDGQVKLVVHHVGETRVTVASAGVSKQLIVKAKHVGKSMQVEISR